MSIEVEGEGRALLGDPDLHGEGAFEDVGEGAEAHRLQIGNKLNKIINPILS